VSPPLVSVLLPVRNAASTVVRAIQSVQAQTWCDWELVAVPNGSTDATMALLEDLTQADQRIQIINMPGADLVAALNGGLQRCGGEYIARMDADDEMHPVRLSRQISALHDHPELGLVGCRVSFGGDESAQAGYAEHVRWLNQQVSPEQLWRSRFVESPFAHPSVMWRRGVSAAHGGYRSGDFPEDYELWLRWWEAGVVMGKVDEDLMTWHDSPNRLSRVDARYAVEAFFRIKAPYIASELERSRRGRQVWIAGAGRPTRRRAAELEKHGITITGYLDVDPRKIGQRIGGLPVVGWCDLPPPSEAVVLSYVGNRGAREKVRTAMEDQGRREGSDYWLCA